ncbi:hypothetical protein Tco_0795211 [Tanacetum coccineum]
MYRGGSRGGDSSGGEMDAVVMTIDGGGGRWCGDDEDDGVEVMAWCRSEGGDDARRLWPESGRRWPETAPEKMERRREEVEFKRISLTGFRSCTSRSHYRSVSKQTTQSRQVTYNMSLIDVGSRRISIVTVNTKEYHSDVLAIITRIMLDSREEGTEFEVTGFDKAFVSPTLGKAVELVSETKDSKGDFDTHGVFRNFTIEISSMSSA